MCKSGTITIFHHLPQTPSTGCCPPSRVLGHFSLPAIPSQHGQHKTHWHSPRGDTEPFLTCEKVWTTQLSSQIIASQKHSPLFRIIRENEPSFTAAHENGPGTEMVWTPHSQLAGVACCPVPLQVFHPTIKGQILLALQQQTP